MLREPRAGERGARGGGERVHHHEDVFDHDETVYDAVEVPDGYRTETYTERVQSGQDCSTTLRTCRRVRALGSPAPVPCSL